MITLSIVAMVLIALYFVACAIRVAAYRKWQRKTPTYCPPAPRGWLLQSVKRTEREAAQKQRQLMREQ